MVKIEKCISYFSNGVTYDINDLEKNIKTSNVVLTADHIDISNKLILKENKFIYLKENAKLSDEKILKKDDIFICTNSGSKKHICKVAFIYDNINMYAGGFMGIIRANNNILPKLLFYILSQEKIKDIFISTGSNINNLKYFTELYIPLPPIEKQKEIVSLMEEQDNIILEQEKIIKEENEKINSLDFANYDKCKLSDKTKFQVSIGKRVLQKNVKENGKYPIYSANVYKPFGYIDELLFDDFNSVFVLWGIDGDWMTNYILPNNPFYPTDHCGVIKCIDNSVNMVYFNYAFNIVGKEYGFNRNLRASIDRIEKLQIPIPDLNKQNEISNTILDCKNKIEQAQLNINKAKTIQKEIMNDIFQID